VDDVRSSGERDDTRRFPGYEAARGANEVTGDAVIGFERSLVGIVRRLKVMLAFVVRADWSLQFLVVRPVQHRPERRHAQREHEDPRRGADERR
jgi:hypothetical protein